ASFTQGSKPITARGFNYGTTSGSYTLSADGAVSGSTFSANITGLTANTTYYYKAYVTTDDGTVYGNEKSFKTNLGAIVIAANESKPIANNYVGDIVIHHGGQISNDTAFSFTGQIRYKRTFNTPIVWHTCCFPFAIDHVTVEEDGVEYTIVPYYQGAPAHSCHFWIKTLDRDPSNPELYQRWTTPTTSTIKKDTAYIIIFPKITDSTSYYDNKVVTFYSTNGNHTINNTDMPVSTYEYTGNGFYFYANLSLRNQSFSGTEFYRLDRTPYTGNFELHENPIIVPSECFIQASDSYKQSSPSILMNFSPEEETVYTGVPPTIFSIPLTITSHDNTICLMSEANQTIEIYSVSGIKIATYTMKNGEVRTLKLPKSVYVIRSNQNDKPLKIIL
ncbi:MAG TPA: fibronectin type III domain-containing protein, partial [Paludibacteraceae bacterium]|nr:fibronectin type III domain-containing protein [Paludibacteraceae bacterium]